MKCTSVPNTAVATDGAFGSSTRIAAFKEMGDPVRISWSPARVAGRQQIHGTQILPASGGPAVLLLASKGCAIDRNGHGSKIPYPQ